MYGSEMSSWARSITSLNSGLLLRAQRRRVFQAAGLSCSPSDSFPLNSAHAYRERKTKHILLSFIKDGVNGCECAFYRKHRHLKERSILIFTEVVFPCMLPGDAEHGFGIIVPHHTRIFPAADLRLNTAVSLKQQLHTMITQLFPDCRFICGS